MSRARANCIAFLSFLATAPWLAAQDAVPATKQPPKFVIGVVDFGKVFEAYPRAIQEKKKLDEYEQQIKAQLEGEEKMAQEIKQQRDLYQTGSTERAMKDLDLRVAAQKLEGRWQILTKELTHKREEFLVAMFGDMQRAIETVAKERGILLVIRAHSDLPEAAGTATKWDLYESRIVWYAAEEIDLTPAVISQLRVQLPAPPKQGDAKDKATKPNGD